MTGYEMYNIIKKNVGMGGAKPRAYCGMSGGAWCNAYVCYAFNQAGQKKLFYGGKKVTYCPTSIQWCRANLAEIPLCLAMPCDIIYFDWQPNGTPDHIGFVKAHRTTTSIFTHEGNTSGGKVAEKTRTLSRHCRMWVFRPHFAPTGLKKEKLTVDGDFGYKSIYNLQIALGLKPDGILGKPTVKALQKKAGASADGAWGKKTSIKVQKMVGAKQDGAFGKSSVKSLQKWINNKNYPAATKPKTTATTKKTNTATKTSTTAKKTATTANAPSAEAKKAVAWAKKIAKNGGYTYKKFDVHNKKTKQCPICHKLTGKYKGWNCIGFVSAAFYHGAGLKSIKCACNGIGVDSFFTKVTLNSWTKRNGAGWKMVTNGGSKGGADIPASKLLAGDALICYDKKGKFHHIALYIGGSKYIDCTNTSKNHIATRPYSKLCGKYHVTRAFRYVG